MGNALEQLKKRLRPGQIYRRAELARYSSTVDRHLQQLVADKTLQKLMNGVYYYPKKASFGAVPPDDEKLVGAFLKDDNFYLASLNAYNSLGVGTTQLYNERLVYNHKRDGYFTLAGRSFYFVKRPRFPKTASSEFLLVDLWPILLSTKERLYSATRVSVRFTMMRMILERF